MKVGDLVTIKPHVQPPHLYGVGLVVDRYELAGIEKIKVRWGKLPKKDPSILNPWSVELISESR